MVRDVVPHSGQGRCSTQVQSLVSGSIRPSSGSLIPRPQSGGPSTPVRDHAVVRASNGSRVGDNGQVPKIIGASLVEHREETRRRLFAALATLIEERGFDSISLADVARAAGIGRTSVYNHVRDKESLLIEFVTYETEQYLAGLEQALDGKTDPVEQLRIYVRHNLRVRPSFHMPQGLRGAVSPATQVQLGEHAQPVEAVLRRILANGMAAGSFANQPLDVTVPLVSACLAARSGRPAVEGRTPSRERDTAALATEAFVLRAVGASL